MNKELALSFASNHVVSMVSCQRQAAKVPAFEIDRFESMCNAVIEKGAELPQSFFDSIPASASKRDIFRAVHEA